MDPITGLAATAAANLLKKVSGSVAHEWNRLTPAQRDAVQSLALDGARLAYASLGGADPDRHAAEWRHLKAQFLSIVAIGGHAIIEALEASLLDWAMTAPRLFATKGGG